MNRKLFYLSYLGYIGLLLAEAQKSLLRHVLTNETDLQYFQLARYLVIHVHREQAQVPS